MTTIRIEHSAEVAAPAAAAYRVIADYRDGHPRILPKEFTGLKVEKGGTGGGTVIRFGMRLLGSTRQTRGEVTEPERGRVLVETYPAEKMATTFTVDPLEGGRACRVTITTEMKGQLWPIGALEGWLLRRLLRPIYAEELKLLGEVARENKWRKTSPRAGG